MKLYDSTPDVLGKALRGLEIAPLEAAERAGISGEALLSFLRGGASPIAVGQLAAILGLDRDALTQLASPRQTIEPPPELRQVVLPFEDDWVNVWQLEHADGSILIDAGFQSGDLLPAIGDFTNFDLLITHSHRDHIGGLSAVSDRARRIFSPSTMSSAELVNPGQVIQSGSWKITVVDLRGHHPSAVGYRIGMGDSDFFAVGDAVFARSIGGCAGKAAYDQARATLLEAWPELNPETLILTGHGPLTTVAMESRENPFIAGWLGR